MNFSIVATTYLPEGNAGEDRLSAFRTAVWSWLHNLTHFPVGDRVDLIIADDGTEEDDYRRLLEWVKGVWTRGVVRETRAVAHGVGASLNRGFRLAFERGPLVLYAVDDWRLMERFDVSPWLQLLDERNDVGVVRLGPPHPSNRLYVQAYTSNWQGWAAEIDPFGGGIAISERPALWHMRMINAVGWFREDCSALVCEADYDERFRNRMQGLLTPRPPSVVLALPHPWYHINPVELSDKDPNVRRSSRTQS